MDTEIKKQKYVSTRILSGIYKAVVELQIDKVKVHLRPCTTRLLSGIWIQKLKCKNMFQTGSYPVSMKQLSNYELLRWKCIRYPDLHGLYLAYGSRNWNTKNVYARILFRFYKVIVDIKIVKVEVHLLDGPTRFPSGIWMQKWKCKNMFQTGSYPVFIKQLLNCKLLRWK